MIQFRSIPLLSASALLLLSSQTLAFSPFVIEDIRIEGLQRIDAGTVFNYLPLKVGDQMDRQKSAEATRSLFKTGFFKDIQLEHEGNVLLISVTERSAIADITIEGNKIIKTELLEDRLKEIGVAEGRVLDRGMLEKVGNELRNQYLVIGRYAAQVDVTVTPLERNRSGIVIKIKEGESAKIAQISIIGNQAFSTEKLLGLFQLNTGNWLSFFTKNNRYSQQKLSGDLETLRSYYLDRGFINFDIESAPVSITRDREGVYITIHLKEGEQYRLGELTLDGEMLVPEEDLQKSLKNLKSGEVFSRKEVMAASEAIKNRLGEDGYAFAEVKVEPYPDKESKTVDLAFVVDSKDRVYVNRINILGNTKTQDMVLRREMRQLEGSRYSNKDVERSAVRLRMLGYFSDVNVETVPVAGTTDQVNLEYSVEEQSTGSVAMGLGYSQASGATFSANLQQDNFLGTGNSVDLTFNNSKTKTAYGVGYFDPYFTKEGIGWGLGGRYQKRDTSEAMSSYSYDVTSIHTKVSLPTSEYDKLWIGVEPQYFRNAECGTSSAAGSECSKFIGNESDSFNVLEVTSRWSRDSRNRALFPDQGVYQRASIEVGTPGGIEYFKMSYDHEYFYPMTEDWTLLLKGKVGVGDGYGDQTELPFFNRFYTGGESSVRGFKSNSLGPTDDAGDAVGGGLKAVTNAELILPVPMLEDVKSLRVSGFVDAGSVANTASDLGGHGRVSTGLSAKWISPIGPMTFSWAVPLNKKDGDDTELFQFMLGRVF